MYWEHSKPAGDEGLGVRLFNHILTAGQPCS